MPEDPPSLARCKRCSAKVRVLPPRFSPCRSFGQVLRGTIMARPSVRASGLALALVVLLASSFLELACELGVRSV